MRLNKYIAHAGVCSRRKAAELVKAGKINVNGQLELNPAIIVEEADVVEYDGKILKPEIEKVYLLMNKPKAVITSLNDEKGRKTVWDMVKDKVTQRIYPVGRLDYNTTGLLLLTNDGTLAEKLSHPRYNIKKIYQVVVKTAITEEQVQSIKDGIELEDGFIKVDKISVLNAERTEIGIEIHSGKNRIIRRIFEFIGHQVTALDRVYYAGLTKKDLPRGWNRPLTQMEIRMLKHFT